MLQARPMGLNSEVQGRKAERRMCALGLGVDQMLWHPIRVQGIGAVCNIPSLRAQRNNVTNGTKAIPGAPGAAPPRHPKRDSTVVLR